MADRHQQGGHIRRHVPTALVAVGLALVTVGAVGCGPDRRSDDECEPDAACVGTDSTMSPPTAIDLQVRPVLSTDPATIEDNPCPTDLPAPVPGEIVVLPECADGTIVALHGLGPSVLNSSAFESARATLNQGTGEWVVNPVLRAGAEGLDAFNAAASRCWAMESVCPTGQLALLVDGVVIAAPAIQSPQFEADQIVLTGSPFTEDEATALAARIDAAG